MAQLSGGRDEVPQASSKLGIVDYWSGWMYFCIMLILSYILVAEEGKILNRVY